MTDTKLKTETCGTCRFYNGILCYRYPPTSVDGRVTPKSIWCGEWQSLKKAIRQQESQEHIDELARGFGLK
ncbi:MAG: hypothetical protein GY847_28990 [Proteobacteria bacterium]|nr:hypothetical protein [Pseudomonadota bacterium]